MADEKHTTPQATTESEGLALKAETLRMVYWRRFKKHTLGKVGAIILIVLYLVALFADILSPYSMVWADKYKSFHPPSNIYWFYKDESGKTSFKPYAYEQRIVNVSKKQYGVIPLYTLRVVSVEPDTNRVELRAMVVDKNPAERKQGIMQAVADHYGLAADSAPMQELSAQIGKIEADRSLDPQYLLTLGTKTYANGEEKPITLYLLKGNKNFLKPFYKGIPYRFFGFIPARVHLFGSPTGGVFFWGTDQLGRDLISRLLHGSRISLSVGIFGAVLSLIPGLIFGGIAGYFGKRVDNVIMRVCEIMMSIPSLYLLFALRATFPAGLPSTVIYLLVISILSLIGWAALARIIRGLVLSIKNEDYVLSARTMGLSPGKIIRKHILPNTMSFVIVQTTLTIPGYILGESALSLLGLGITEPQSSWGNMLSVARNSRIIQDFPWILAPGFLIFISIMAWNFFGDGIRDAVDPKSKH